MEQPEEKRNVRTDDNNAKAETQQTVLTTEPDEKNSGQEGGEERTVESASGVKEEEDGGKRTADEQSKALESDPDVDMRCSKNGLAKNALCHQEAEWGRMHQDPSDTESPIVAFAFSLENHNTTTELFNDESVRVANCPVRITREKAERLPKSYPRRRFGEEEEHNMVAIWMDPGTYRELAGKLWEILYVCDRATGEILGVHSIKISESIVPNQPMPKKGDGDAAEDEDEEEELERNAKSELDPPDADLMARFRDIVIPEWPEGELSGCFPHHDLYGNSRTPEYDYFLVRRRNLSEHEMAFSLLSQGTRA